MNEVLAYAMGAASLFGVVAPNSGNQTILVKYGTEEQKQKWLLPLIDGTTRIRLLHDRAGRRRLRPPVAADDGAAAMATSGSSTATSGSRPTAIAADFFIVMCRTEDPDGPAGPTADDADHRPQRHARGQHRCAASTCGASESDHCEIVYEDVRVPVGNQSRQPGQRPPGGPGPPRRRPRLPLHELGRPDVAGVRPDGRAVHGSARCTAACCRPSSSSRASSPTRYIDIQAARLMTIHCAEKMASERPRAPTSRPSRSSCPPPTSGSSTAPSRCGARPACRATSRLYAMYQGARTLRLADGPDEVHRILIAKNVLAQFSHGDRLGLRQLKHMNLG